jgi:hypothetical protein
MKTLDLVFTRQLDSGISAFAIIRVTSNAQHHDGALVLLKKAVTAWVDTTPEGQQLWDYSGGSLNIGDLANEIEECDSLALAFKKENITVTVVSVNQGELILDINTKKLSYDLVLADIKEEL